MSSMQDATQWHTKQNTALPADIDSINFDDIAAREIATSGELQATQVALANLRDAALTAISWLANWRTGLASAYELNERMNALKCAVATCVPCATPLPILQTFPYGVDCLKFTSIDKNQSDLGY